MIGTRHLQRLASSMAGMRLDLFWDTFDLASPAGLDGSAASPAGCSLRSSKHGSPQAIRLVYFSTHAIARLLQVKAPRPAFRWQN